MFTIGLSLSYSIVIVEGRRSRSEPDSASVVCPLPFEFSTAPTCRTSLGCHMSNFMLDGREGGDTINPTLQDVNAEVLCTYSMTKILQFRSRTVSYTKFVINYLNGVFVIFILLLYVLITARCITVQSAVLLSHVVCPSVCPSLCPSVVPGVTCYAVID